MAEDEATSDLVIVEERPGYVVADIYASWQPKFVEGLRLGFGIDNVLDHDHDRVYVGVSEPGRKFKVTAAWQFGQ